MFRQRIIYCFVGLLILASLACNAFTGAVEPALTLPPPPTTVVETVPMPDSVEALPDEIAPTATLPEGVIADVTAAASGEATVTMLVDLNIRGGPGVQYDRISFMLQGENARIVGMDPGTGWWKIECPRRTESASCWVSGGSQYTAVVNTEGVPIAAVPPTPTPIPPTATPDAENNVITRGVLAFESDNRLWVTTLDIGGVPPSAEDPVPLTDGTDVERIFISPDGRKVAYTSGSTGTNALHVINVDGGGDTILLSATDIPIRIEGDTADLVVLIDQVHWLGDSQSIAFNTYVSNQVGPGVGSQEDLWTVTLDGTLTERFTAGQGGGIFAIQNKKILMSQKDAIIRANLDGSDREKLIQFDLVNTASEFIYYPYPQWTVDGSRAYIAIPGPEPFIPDAETALWEIPPTGPAELLTTVLGNTLFYPVVWSSDGASLAYIQQIEGGAVNPPTLVLSDGAGQDLAPYASDEQLAFYGWNPVGDRFLYSGEAFYMIGQPGAVSIETTIPVGMAPARWLTSSAFVVAVSSDDTWQINSANLSGKILPLVTATTDNIQFDVWTP